EAMGVQRTQDSMKKASLILYLFDLTNTNTEEILREEAEIKMLDVPYLKIGNKLDTATEEVIKNLGNDFILISAAAKINLDELKERIVALFQVREVKKGDVVVTNLRHYQNLLQTNLSLIRVLEGMDTHATGDFLAMDIRQSLHYLGEITGQITSDDLLSNIFSKFCIGK
ncbi:MAG: tRNA uridine-5-carboxymethylaminomethyl(34) synthesis GTPase MnmE, partial [Flammeovirgaceae bacterium]